MITMTECLVRAEAVEDVAEFERWDAALHDAIGVATHNQAAIAMTRALARVRQVTPEKITIDKSAANTAAIESYSTDHNAGIEIRWVKYLNNIVEQDHRALKRQVRPMLGFKSFLSAATPAGIELMHVIRKGQLRTTGKLRSAHQFYSLAG
jgi:transposase-like protein